ncbi:carboxypeptidase regulatory-like domain-containing protein [Pseudenhygromyxa sp. WMMC2535]|uniref:TonB-dependent receptor n=1 Tax=Pseudenhygromyxa sp. WMMC2535 TaxID=2712867 RepID=UPI001557C10E|nr:TonB-dependent receptor [Pseudenhygromyxa sp. WMMC2535]NVB43264.1 carboxypeptidase regulatory-like domain-containing protein [Pseudenhygromyxa sp. WMMC2535]
MKRHRNLQRWGFALPGFLVLGAAPQALAAPPEDDFEFDDGSEDSGDDDGFDFDDGSEDAPEGGDDEFVISPDDGEGGGDAEGGEDDEFVIAPESGEGDASPGEDGGDDDWGDDWGDEGEIGEDDAFFFEDISEDQEALDAELKSGEVQAEGAVGTVTGVVRNAKAEPLAGVYVRAKGTDYVARTGVDGSYELKLPPGVHTLEVELDLYERVEIPELSVAEGAAQAQDVELVPMTGVMETFEVADDLNLEAEGALQEARKQKTSVNDGIDASEMSKAGGGKVASVAVRIVGATVVDGRYLFVRGLGHRYGNTLLDGARVPSPEPELRTVPLDVFPSGALSAINIQKTFTPDVPGDFAGGSTQFVTRDAPSEPTVSLGVSMGMNTNTSFREMATDAGYGGYDFFALGNIPRGIPGSFPANSAVGRGALDDNLEEKWTTEEIEAQGESLDTRTKIIRGGLAPANFGLKLTAGNSWKLNERGGKFGLLFSGSYENEHQTNNEIIKQYGLEEGEPSLTTPQVDLESFKTDYVTNFNGLLKLQLDVDSDNRFALTGLYAREAHDETRDMYGTVRSVSGAGLINYTRQRYQMSAIAFTELRGEHRIRRAKDLTIDYFGSFSQARRDDPSMREMVYLYNSDQDYYQIDTSNGPTGNQLFLDLTDNNENAGLNFTLPFRQWKGLDSKLEFGAWIDAKQREFIARRFDYNYATGLFDAVPNGQDNPINASTIGGGVSAANGGTQPFVLVDRLRKQDNYTAWSRNIAGYVMLDLPFVRWFKINGGVRLESNVIDAQPFDLYNPDETDSDLEGAHLVDLDWLPSASLVFSPGLPEDAGDLNIRLGGSRTVARPEFRELAPFQFRDYIGGFSKQGYQDLVSTKIWNADLRVEWFPRANEVVAVSAFFKHFEDPIEEVIGASDNPSASWANAEGAINSGFEVEFRKALDFLAPEDAGRAKDLLRDLSIGANFAYIYSRVQLGAPCYLPGNESELEGAVPDENCREAYQVSTSRVRPLQGQSPWIINAYLDYANDESGTSARIMYNAFGPYIYQVQGLGLPDMVQQPMHQLDLTASQRLLAYKRNEWGDLRNQLMLDFEVGNILNTRERRTLGYDPDGPVTYETRDGVSFKIGLTWKY